MTGVVRQRKEVDRELALSHELDELAEAEARGEVDSPPLRRARTGRYEVFSVRLPEEAAAELHRVASSEGVSAGVVLRQWALNALTGSAAPMLTHKQAEQLFRETLQEAASQAVDSLTAAAGAAGRTGLNLGPRLVHDRARDRHRRVG